MAMDEREASAQSRIWDFLKEVEPSPVRMARARKLAAVEEATIVEPVAASGQAEEFSLFVEAHAREAATLASTLIADTSVRLEEMRGELKDEATDRAELVEQAVETCREIAATRNPELAAVVLMMFLTHFVDVQGFSVPPLAVRSPYWVLPSRVGAGSTAPDNQLDWFREDPMFNEHHEHWHIVYPFAGIRNKVRDRQGEMFLYMHQQMLARYDAERLALGIPPTIPFDDMTSPMASGYDPGPYVATSFPYFASRPAGLRIADLDRPMYGFPGSFKLTVAAQDSHYSRLRDAVRRGYLRNKDGNLLRITPDLLGHTIEASNLENVDSGYYGSFHNNGHRFIAACHDPDNGKGQPLGVMARPETSFRDPIFFQWHKAIDDLSFDWQQAQPVNDLSDAPNVALRSGRASDGGPWSPDLIICDRAAVETLRQRGLSMDAIASGAFGGANWRGDFSASEARWSDPETGAAHALATTGEVRTFMAHDVIVYEGEIFGYPYLNHDAVTYFLRIENHHPEPRDVTVRLFLVPEGQEDDRRKYIEMDKFRTRLNARDDRRNIVWRHDEQSSIVRKPVIKDPGSYNRTYDPSFGGWLPAAVHVYVREVPAGDLEQMAKALTGYHDSALGFRIERFGEEGDFDAIEAQLILARLQLGTPVKEAEIEAYRKLLDRYYEVLTDFNFDRAYCGCGYPYSLLFPRGTEAGMVFHLWVLVTDWEKDRVEEEHRCASMSFCGAKDRYPDMRAMGYPFDRPFDGAIETVLERQQNAAGRRIMIRRRD